MPFLGGVITPVLRPTILPPNIDCPGGGVVVGTGVVLAIAVGARSVVPVLDPGAAAVVPVPAGGTVVLLLADSVVDMPLCCYITYSCCWNIRNNT